MVPLQYGVEHAERSVLPIADHLFLQPVEQLGVLSLHGLWNTSEMQRSSTAGRYLTQLLLQVLDLRIRLLALFGEVVPEL